LPFFRVSSRIELGLETTNVYKCSFLEKYLFVQEGEGPKTPRAFNTPQKESNKFKATTWNSNLALFSSFHL
jgi:hypothetical protein